MSRGPGKLQRYLFHALTMALRECNRLLTFKELATIAVGEDYFGPHFERSLRRALRKMVDANVVAAAAQEIRTATSLPVALTGGLNTAIGEMGARDA